jgi:hypothetical protein
MDEYEKKKKVEREVEEITEAMICLSTSDSGKDQVKEEKN